MTMIYRGHTIYYDTQSIRGKNGEVGNNNQLVYTIILC